MTELTPHFLGTPCQDSLPRTFQVATWNVWFDKHLRAERNAALLSCLELHRPAVMAFQEVTLPFIRALQACAWLADGYWISGQEHHEIGVVLVSRIKVERLYFQNLTSPMGRRLLVADFGSGFRIATAHFESNRTTSELRATQFTEAVGAIQGASAWILVGDFNCAPDSQESQVFCSMGADVWPVLYPQDPGFTYDTNLNAMAWAQKRTPVQVRMDRILCGGTAQAHRIQLLGREPFQPAGFASDHFGLLAEISIGREPNVYGEQAAHSAYRAR